VDDAAGWLDISDFFLGYNPLIFDILLFQDI
jgi:hypothetical protein